MNPHNIHTFGILEAPPRTLLFTQRRDMNKSWWHFPSLTLSDFTFKKAYKSIINFRLHFLRLFCAFIFQRKQKPSLWHDWIHQINFHFSNIEFKNAKYEKIDLITSLFSMNIIFWEVGNTKVNMNTTNTSWSSQHKEYKYYISS